ncbi:MAG: hydrogenase nickel incorporation protein HypB [Actinocatenispora sp.]
MCDTCGCSDDAGVRVSAPLPAPHEPAHTHFPAPHDHAGHAHAPHGDRRDALQGAGATRTVRLEEPVLARNDALARRHRDWFTDQGVLAVNLMSSPGSGKTTLLERTVTALAGSVPVSVVEGDQETLLDAQRLSATGCRTVQINTGAGCHLDASMMDTALRTLEPPPRSVLFIENVGNLVCPALFDLGESVRVVVMSVTEGADKPLKYPHMFRTADLVLLNKVDLLPHVDFDVDRCLDAARRARPDVPMLRVSATTGVGLDSWYDWLRSRLPATDPAALSVPR